MSFANSPGGSRSEAGNSRLRHAIDKLRRASSKRNDISKDVIQDATNHLSQYASIRGLPNDTLDTVIDILTTPSKLDQATIGSIIKNLYPRHKVSEEIVVKVVGCFGPGQSKPALQTQALLLRWLVMTYNIMEGYTLLSQLYGILFNMLDMITLRAHLCHLLSLLTRRKHVKPFRIQALLELKRIVGNEQPLLGLLQIYKDYYPDVIVERLPSTKLSLFSHPSPEWMEKLRLIQEANVDGYSEKAEQPSFQVIRQHGGKRRKTVYLSAPEVRTYRALETTVTLEEIANVDDFVARLDKLELPNQLAAVVEDPLLQKLLNLQMSEIDQQRINNWLSAYLFSGLGSPSTEPAEWVKQFLQKILRYTRYTKTLLPSVQKYLKTCLRRQDNLFHLDYILELLTFLPLGDFQDLYTNFFSPLDKIYGTGNTEASARLIGYYTGLLRYWILMHGSQNEDKHPTNAEDCIIHYMWHVGALCIRALQQSQQSPQVCNSALTFYEVAASFPVGHGAFRLVLPPDSLVYHTLYAGDALALSRMCGILARYKRNIEETRKLATSNRSNGVLEYPRAVTTHMNGLVTDVCNCIWRNRGFVDDVNALGYSFSKEFIAHMTRILGDDLKHLYSLARSLPLSPLSQSIFSDMELSLEIPLAQRHRGPPTVESLKSLQKAGGLEISWKEYKKEVLVGLERRGFKGLPELMYVTLTVFISEGAGTAASSSLRA